MSKGQKTATIKKNLKERLDLYKYDEQLANTWKLIKKELPGFVAMYEKYDDLFVNQ